MVTASHIHQNHICWGGAHTHSREHHLSIKQLSAAYGTHIVLEDISYSISCGHTLALIGPNGAGKSTLLNLLAGLLRPRSGCILWNGNDLSQFRSETAYLPQRSEVDWAFPITVRELVEMGRYPNLGMWRAFRKHDSDIVDKALETLGLTELQKRQIGALSGGQQQRCFLARALAQEAHILLLDEPFTGLDVPGVEALSLILKDLASEGRLVIASHHDLATAPQIFDEALLLKRQLLAAGPTATILSPENLMKAFGSTSSAQK